MIKFGIAGIVFLMQSFQYIYSCMYKPGFHDCPRKHGRHHVCICKGLCISGKCISCRRCFRHDFYQFLHFLYPGWSLTHSLVLTCLIIMLHLAYSFELAWFFELAHFMLAWSSLDVTLTCCLELVPFHFVLSWTCVNNWLFELTLACFHARLIMISCF